MGTQKIWAVSGYAHAPFSAKFVIDFYVTLIHQRYRRTKGQTDRQTTCNLNTAFCTMVHRGVKTAS